MKHCPTCTCGNCKSQEQTIWQRGKDSLDSYPGLHKPAAKNISKVTRNQVAETYYIDRTSQSDRPSPSPAQFPSPQQKKQIIDICKRDKGREEICGVIDRQGRVHQLPNISHKDKKNTFNLDYKSKGIDAVAIWHRHLAANGHSGDVSGGDVEMAKERGVSMLMVYDEGRDDMPYEQYTWGEFHPKGIPQFVQSQSQAQTPTHPHSLTPQQKQQIINFCKWNNREEIGGIITSQGEVIQLPNLAKDKRSHFQFTWNGRDSVAIWHQHCKNLNHSNELSQPDIDAANQSGLSMYMVYNPDWTFREYHPNGTPNTIPKRNYSVSFACPTAAQIMRQQKQAVQWIQEDNNKLKQVVTSAVGEIQEKQRQVIATVTKALTTSTNAQDKSQAIALRLKMATTQPTKLLPPGQGVKADGFIRMGKQQPKQQPIHARQRNN